MRITVDLPEEELEKAMRHAGAKTKSEAVMMAIREFNRRRRMQSVTSRFGTFDDFMSQEELRRMRGVN